MGALLLLLPVEKAPLVGIQLPDILKDAAHPVYRPGVGVQVVLHDHVFVDEGRNMIDAGHTGDEPVDVVLGKAHHHSGFFSARLLAGAAREDPDDIRAPLREDGLDGALEPGAIGQQQNNRVAIPHAMPTMVMAVRRRL